MVLKRLFEDYDLPIEKILIKEYKRLKITFEELSVLLVLFSLYRKKNFSISAIAKKSELTINKVSEVMNSLMDKELITIELEKKDDKEREILSLDQVFIKTENLFLEDEQDKKVSASDSEISKTIEQLEEFLKRSLTDNELERIRTWYEKEFTFEKIDGAIRIAKTLNKPSLKAIERLLQKSEMISEIDEETSKALDDIFNKIK